MVFDTFGIRFGNIFRNAERQQELQNQFVPLLGHPGQCASTIGKKDGAVGLRRDKSLPLKPLDGLRDRHVTDSETVGQIDRSRFPSFFDERVDEFHIVLRILTTVVLASSLKSAGG